MKKKVFAAVLAVSMLMMTACGSTQETTVSSNSEETTAEVTTEATAETTEGESEVIESEASQDDVIIPLYDYIYADQIKQMSPESVASDFYNTIAPYMLLGTLVYEDANTKVYQLVIDSVSHPIFTLGNTGNDSTEVEVYLCLSPEGVSTTSFNTSTGASDSIDFIQLFYNETKKCLVGYSGYNTNNPGFREVYWDDVIGITIPTDVDPANYGF